MRERIHYTLVRADHKLGKNKYVQGRISGMLDVFIYGEDTENIRYGCGEIEDGFIIVNKCSNRLYNRAADRIEEMYPGLCVFDYQIHRESN